MTSLALPATTVSRDPTPPASIGDGLPHSALTPVFSGLRIGLHVMIVALTGLVVVRTLVGAAPNPVTVVTLALVFLATYVGGSELARRRPWRFVVPVDVESVGSCSGMASRPRPAAPTNRGDEQTGPA